MTTLESVALLPAVTDKLRHAIVEVLRIANSVIKKQT